MSPKNSEKCHSCAAELEKSGDIRTAEDLAQYYAALDAGYGRYAFIGLFILAVMPVIAIIGAIAIVTARAAGASESIVIPAIILCFIILIVGVSLTFAGVRVLSGNLSRPETTSDKLQILAYGSVLTFGACAIITILAAVPLLNIVVVPLFYTYIIVITKKYYKRNNTGRLSAINGLIDLNTSESKAQATALDLLLRTPESNVTSAHRNLVIEILKQNPSVIPDFASSDSMLNAAKEMFVEDEDNEEKLIKLLLDSGRTQPANSSLLTNIDRFKAAEELAVSFDLNSYMERARTEIAIRENLKTADKDIYEETVSELAATVQTLEGLVEELVEFGQKSRQNYRFEKANQQFEAAENIAHEYDLPNLQADAESEKSATENLVFAAMFLTAEELSKILPEPSPENIIECLIETGRDHRSEEQFTKAAECIEAAEILCDENDDETFSDVVNSELSKTNTQMALAEFEAESNELFDLVRSAEGAIDSGQYQKAINRFQTVENRLPPELPGQGSAQKSYTELVTRVEEGIIVAGKHQLSELLPESPTPLERKLVILAVPDIIGDNLDAIYTDTLSDDLHRQIIEQVDVDILSNADEIVNTYRNCQVTIDDVVDRSQRYQSVLNNLVEQSVSEGFEGPQTERTGEQTSSINKIGTERESQDTDLTESIRAVNKAVEIGTAFSGTLAYLAEINAKEPNPSIESCLEAIRKALASRRRLQSKTDFEQIQDVLERLEEVDSYVTAFPSLSIDNIVDEISAAIKNGAAIEPATFSSEFERINRLVEQEIGRLTDEIETFIDKWKDHPAINQQVWRRAILEARETADPQPLLEPYSAMQKMQDSMWTQQGLQEFSWSAFEQLIANLYEQQGYNTTVTQGSNDRGVDVWAENETERIAIQVKQFAKGNVVGRPVIQKLESTLARGDADRIAIVTSSTFANTAKQYAARSTNVQLIDGDDLIAKLTNFEVPAASV